MAQEIIVLVLFLCAVVYLYKKLIPKRKKIPSLSEPGAKQEGHCGCGSSCPLKKNQ